MRFHLEKVELKQLICSSANSSRFERLWGSSSLHEADAYSKILGFEWNVVTDQFRVSISETPPGTIPTNRNITSDVAKVFDVLGFLFPSTIKMKI